MNEDGRDLGAYSLSEYADKYYCKDELNMNKDDLFDMYDRYMTYADTYKDKKHKSVKRRKAPRKIVKRYTHFAPSVSVKMLLFTRWMATCYTTVEMNESDGKWWKDRLQHFYDKVYPEYEKNGSVKNTEELINPKK